jgi:hypothetical protein
MSDDRTGPPVINRAARRRPRPEGRQGVLDLRSDLLGGWVRVKVPEPDGPFWRAEDGTRHSYGSLRCGLDAERARELRNAHRETTRLAVAAGRLYEEIAGRWTPAAVEVTRR